MSADYEYICMHMKWMHFITCPLANGYPLLLFFLQYGYSCVSSVQDILLMWFAFYCRKLIFAWDQKTTPCLWVSFRFGLTIYPSNPGDKRFQSPQSFSELSWFERSFANAIYIERWNKIYVNKKLGDYQWFREFWAQVVLKSIFQRGKANWKLIYPSTPDAKRLI